MAKTMKTTKGSLYSELYQRIWEMVNQIPFGKVATYGQIAKMVGLGSHARVVGYALHSLPESSTIPWHRVINSTGEISLPKEGGLYALQKALLEQEDIVFYGEKINLAKYGWQPGVETE